MDYIIAGLILWCIFLHGWIWHTRRLLAELAEICAYHAEQTRELADAGLDNVRLIADLDRRVRAKT